jgi:hypothetical protein
MKTLGNRVKEIPNPEESLSETLAAIHPGAAKAFKQRMKFLADIRKKRSKK